ncbi:MAG: type VI secretion system lipoprotein TssJ [Deltaproteobacteria bacterium]
MVRRGSRILGAALLALGCAAPPPPAAPGATPACQREAAALILAAGEQVNANAGGPGLPVAVRLYQLRSDARLRNATFDSIWQDDKAALKGDLLEMSEQTAYPGQSLRWKLSLSPEASVIAAVALFREPKGKDWFVTFDLEPLRTKPPCPATEPEISLWVDRTKIQDGSGHETRVPGTPPHP